MQSERYFTRKEAEKTLPLVKKIVSDILETAQNIRDRSADGGSHDGDLLLNEYQAQLEEYFAELESMGCYFRDWNFTIGLVDFPAQINGEVVFLCWRSDEDRLGYYHHIEDGYAGRTPLPPDWTGE